MIQLPATLARLNIRAGELDIEDHPRAASAAFCSTTRRIMRQVLNGFCITNREGRLRSMRDIPLAPRTAIERDAHKVDASFGQCQRNRTVKGRPLKDQYHKTSVTTSPPLFTVLIATHNHAQFLSTTLASVERQSLSDFEIVIVDDGSTDNTFEMLVNWARNSPLSDVTILRTENMGQSAALEVGFGFSRGLWIALLDSDDTWLESKLERVAHSIEADTNLSMVMHQLEIISETGVSVGTTRPMQASMSHGDVATEVRRTARIVAPATSGISIRASVFCRLLPMATGKFKEAADSYLTFGAALAGPVFAINVVLGQYRIHREGQYLKRMLSAEGLARTCAIQQTVATHYGLSQAYHHNPYFMRNELALRKLSGRYLDGLRLVPPLLLSTLRDTHFRLRVRLAASLTWLVVAVLPSKYFEVIWRRIQMRHAGMRPAEYGGELSSE